MKRKATLRVDSSRSTAPSSEAPQQSSPWKLVRRLLACVVLVIFIIATAGYLTSIRKHEETLSEAQPAATEALIDSSSVRKQDEKLVIGLVEEHHHVLAYYERLDQKSLTILHLDSHADMGVPLPPVPGQPLESSAAINDFLTLAAYHGIADHLIFIEPPWSNQFRCCVYTDRATFHFVAGLDASGDVYVDVAGSTAETLTGDRFRHIFWRDGETRVKPAAELSDLRHFKVSVIAAELPMPQIGKLLLDWITGPWILDVDLDFWCSESPGAKRIMNNVNHEALQVVYHLLWNFPDLGVDYMRAADPRGRDSGSSAAFVEMAEKAAGKGESQLAELLGRIGERRGLDARTQSALTNWAASIDGGHDYDEDDVEAFREQPYHTPTLRDLRLELAFSLNEVWRPILSVLPRPRLVNVVRSPGYVPNYALSDLECTVLAALTGLYDDSEVSYESRVAPRRTNCPPINHRSRPLYHINTNVDR